MASQVYLELRETEARLEKMEPLVSKVYQVHKALRATLARLDYLDTKDLPVNKETLVYLGLRDQEVIEDRQDRLERLDYRDRLGQRDLKVCPEMRVSLDLQEKLVLEDLEEQRALKVDLEAWVHKVCLVSRVNLANLVHQVLLVLQERLSRFRLEEVAEKCR